ncbi:bifunctional folylpolyglutamate synthase/dihydrofolate synthase [Candidatus Synechococcus calcipolaris G9]|uniref:Bifunctional folylpolyglutamate synthase/dihydrofolate synthase n=1 Tax=Candidatus Synechococcus calcipolaris G9 TaxID=1497997 RepID=A0ABT6F1A9_9SYNE|nr:folylpolyglutamate synthase/dihydrofolate synthase family protein [Candidatus Synechococcus calcipolaris]MDG2991644.1 bifunctional folylpolyglutamate synthase/dihydrofolate synthase [Candidatus Synechococcus calcipolaris G9]
MDGAFPNPGLDAVDQRLTAYSRFGVRLGLEPIQAILCQLGQPQESMPIIHVAGTNGKGSVCAYLSSIFTAAGYQTGCYTSPHLRDWTERITLNQRAIAPERLLELLLQVEGIIPKIEYSPSQFEVLTAAAWLYFAQEEVDIAIIEVGLGGRLDATNVCPVPLVSVITSIGWDHWQRLGSTIGAIAQEKAGIFKSGGYGVIGPVPPEAEVVIQNQLNLLQNKSIWPEPAQPIPAPEPTDSRTWAKQTWAKWRTYTYPLVLAGDMQLINSSLAIASVDRLRHQGWEISDLAIQQGMAQTHWPGRLQWINYQGQRILIDGAHNEPAAVFLRQYLDQILAKRPETAVTWIIGLLQNKDHQGILGALLRPGDRLYLVPIPNHICADPVALQVLGDRLCPNLETCQTWPDWQRALHQSSLQTEQNYLTVIAGSLYLVGQVLTTLAEP